MSKIVLKKSSVVAKVPLVGDLDYGELALNYADGKLYYKKSDGTTVDYFKSGVSGTVTSVGLSLPTGFSVSSSPITASGTFTVSFSSGYSLPTTASQANWDTAYSERSTWSGTSSGLNAVTGRTSLGATTAGSSLFTLSNPSAISFLRINADNSVSALDAATFRSAIGAQASGSYLTTETDTLASVAARGSTTYAQINLLNPSQTTSTSTGALVVANGVAVGGNLLHGGERIAADTAGAPVYYNRATKVVVSTASANLDSWSTSLYRSAKYLVQVAQAGFYQVSEILVVHNGTDTFITEYGVLNTGGQLASISASIQSGSVVLQASMQSTAASATVSIDRTLMLA